MNKLYTVRATFDFVVVAESDLEAHRIAPGYIKDALDDISAFDVDIDVSEGVTAEGWDGECVPYGGDGNTRTKDYT